MEAKQKAIQEVYGFLNDMIDENGWATYAIDEVGESGIEPFGDYEVQSEKDGVTVWRPLSLQGIENNNGWIKIENEADLPKDAIEKETDFWLCINNVPFIGYFYIAIGGLKYCCRDFNSLPNEIKGIHIGKVEELQGYQPIHKPKPLIYQTMNKADNLPMSAEECFNLNKEL